MFQVEVKIDLEAYEKEMAFWQDQIPFAMMKAINACAIDAQSAIRQDINDNFHVRKKGFINNQVKISPFAKKDTLSATVLIAGPKSDPERNLLAKFEDGGTKTSLTGGNIAIPSHQLRPDDMMLVKKKDRPKNLQHAFKMVLKNGKQVIMQRVGSGANGLKLMYELVKSATIPKKLHVTSLGPAVVQRNWARNWEAAWNNAVNTSYAKSASEAIESIFG